MSNYLGSTRSEHIKAFDSYVSETKVALAKPEIVTLLGERATLLLDASSRLFLPNISHGKIEVPKSYRDKDSIGFLPILVGDEDAVVATGIGRSFYEASPRRREIMLEGYKVGFGEVSASKALGLDLIDVVNEGVALNQAYRVVEEGQIGGALGDLGILKTRAMAVAVGQGDLYETFPSHYAGRPFINIFDEMIVPEEHRKSSALSHELWHAISIENRKTEKTQNERALEELVAYYISFVFNTQFDVKHPVMGRSVVEIEAFRKKHSITMENLSITDEQVKELEVLGAISRVETED